MHSIETMSRTGNFCGNIFQNFEELCVEIFDFPLVVNDFV